MFVDTNYFIALYNKTDSLHERAVKISKIIQRKQLELQTSHYIFLETVTVFSQRVDRSSACSLGNHLQESNFLEILEIDNKLFQRSWEIFLEEQNKNLSFVDCSILALLERYKINTLLTFDTSDFKPLQKKYGFSIFNF